MQHLQGSGMPVLYIGRTVLKVKKDYVPSRRVTEGWPLQERIGILKYLLICNKNEMNRKTE